MMIRTSLSPSDVTPAAYLLPSAMSLSSRAATRGSTIADVYPVADWRSARSLGGQLDGVAGVDLGELARDRRGRSGARSRSCRSPRRRSRPGPCCPACAGTVFSPAATRSMLAAGRCCAPRCGWSGRAPARSGSARGRAHSSPFSQSDFARRFSASASAPSSRSLRLVPPRLPLRGGRACAIAWSASWRFVRVRLTGLWSLVSTSGKVTGRFVLSGPRSWGATGSRV